MKALHVNSVLSSITSSIIVCWFNFLWGKHGCCTFNFYWVKLSFNILWGELGCCTLNFLWVKLSFSITTIFSMWDKLSSRAFLIWKKNTFITKYFHFINHQTKYISFITWQKQFHFIITKKFSAYFHHFHAKFNIFNHYSSKERPYSFEIIF